MTAKKVFLTGATGFVGGFIVEALLQENYEVYIAARKSSDFSYIDINKVKIVYPNLAESASIASVLKEYHINFVIHNAGLTRHPVESELYDVNAKYAQNMANAIMESKIKINKFIHISSLAAFGPADFTEQGIVNHQSDPRPVTAYGRSKLAGEQMLLSYPEIPKIILRPTAVYGPREKDLLSVFKMISNGLEINIGSSPQTLSFIYVKDLAQLVLRSLESSIVNQSYFVSDGNRYSNLELNQYIKDAIGRKTLKITLPMGIVKPMSIVSEYLGSLFGKYPVFNKDKYNEIIARSWLCDSRDLLRDMNYEVQYPLQAGIQETVSWYQENGWI